MSRTLLNLAELQTQLQELNSGSDNEWTVVRDRLYKSIVFRNFIDAFGFMTRAAIVAEKMDHHPNWSNVYKTVEINLYTHDAGGITELDFQLASAMDKLL